MSVSFQRKGFAAVISMILAAGISLAGAQAEDAIAPLMPAAAPNAATDPALFDATATTTDAETDAVVAGSEPDPSFFDRNGLERCWHGYVHKQSETAAADLTNAPPF